MLPEIGELVFSFVVGYMGALEFLYVVRHLYHWGFRHNMQMRDYKSEAESLRKLQEQLKNAIAEAKEREEALGLKAMNDGVMYKDGFRIDEDRKKIEELKEKVKMQEKIAERQREIEAELERQRKIEEETKQQLKKAEEELRRMEEEKLREKQKAEEEKRRAEEMKRKAEEEAKRKAEEAKRKAEDEKRKAEAEENMKKILEAEKKKEEEQRRHEEEIENQRKLIEAEREKEERERLLELEAKKKKEEEQRRHEEEIENQRKLIEAEREREEKQRLLELEAEKKREEEKRRKEEEIENERKLLQAEMERQEKQRQLEIEAEKQRIAEEQLRREQEENELKLLQAEREREEKQRLQEIEDEKVVQKLLEEEREREKAEKEQTLRLLEAERQQQAAEREAALERENEENVRNLLKAERELELKKQEMEAEAANLQRLIEAEKQMEERQRQIDEEALQKLKNAQEETELRQTSFDPNTEVDEAAFVKKEIAQADQSVPQTVKTQYGQTTSESFKPKTMLFPGVSEESSSAEPSSSLQSSFSTQQSSEAVQQDLHFDEYERQAPDGGEDMPSLQYSDDYLRSLDGIKNKPLVREDGSGRRRAFKKRRSSGSSTSSRESRASREEELKMFTSLEEEEFENIRKGDSEYESIKYASESNLKVGKQHRRHKRSPAKDSRRDPNDKGSLQMLDEEESNPWGEVKPENYKDTEFWKREKNTSIDEEHEEFDDKHRTQSPSTAAVNIPKMSSFEEATKSQHEEAIAALKRQKSKDPEPITEVDEQSETKNVSKIADARLSPAGSNSSPNSASASATAPASASASISSALNSPEYKRENSLETEDNKARTPSPTTGLRRSPRVEEMREYEQKFKSEEQRARFEVGENPNIEIECASDEEPMSPEHLPEGISDFYDFNAAINPSRSRSRSRSKTPALTRSVSLPERRTPSPLNYSHIPARSESRSPSPDPASYKFIVERIIPTLDADQPQTSDHGLSDFYDFNTKLNRDALPGATTRRNQELHRTSVDYVLEDLRNEDEAKTKKIEDLSTPSINPEYERSISDEMRDIERIKEEIRKGAFKRSTYVGESMDFSDEFESLREEAKNFRRSRSRSRTPVFDDIKEVTPRLLAKKQIQEQILEDIRNNYENTEEISIEITKDIVDRNRRASDSVLIQKPEIIFQIQDLISETDENFNVIDCEPEEYHHFRRFSLGQEIPVEQYPEDYSYVSEIEIEPFVDLKTLAGKLENLQELEALQKEDQIEDAYESGSDDERQTVVEVDDEIDEDIWEYNEKPAEESHNEQSECEEADREIDRYAGRNADDWRDVEGAVGGVSDEDSFQIDRIYDEAIKNRKPSGILRDFDCILKEIQISDQDRFEVEENQLEKSSYSKSKFTRSLDAGIWSPRNRSSRGSSRDSSRSLIEYERRDTEMRYLADPTMSAINSTRLRSRYGIVPSTSLPTGFEDDISDVDLNYVPKKEYKWRKNFKLDDDVDENKEKNHENQTLDSRKFSLGGESIILFSQSPEHHVKDTQNISAINEEEQLDNTIDQEPEQTEKSSKSSKKRKNKRKSRKGSKGSLGGNEQEQETISPPINQINAEVESTKKKSRRESKKVSEMLPETVNAQENKQSQQDEETESSHGKKKSKKHKKPKYEIVLPKLDIIIPTPEKTAPAPSVAALRAALSAPPTVAPENKSPSTSIKPKKLWETPTPIADKPPLKTDSKPILSNSIRSSISPQPAKVVQPSVTPQPLLVPTANENGIIAVLQTQNQQTILNHVEESKTSSFQTVAFTLESHVVTLKKDEIQVTEIIRSDISQHKASETKNSNSSESTNNTNKNPELPRTENNVDIVSTKDQSPYPEVSKSELPVLENSSEPSTESTQNPTTIPKTDETIIPPDSINDQTPNNVNLEPDILKDGGLYPLF